MGCLIALTCHDQEQPHRQCASTQTSRKQILMLVSLVRTPLVALSHRRRQNNIYVKRKEMVRPSKAEKVLGRVEKGVHYLERGVALAHGLYRVGQSLAPLAAAMV